MRFQNNQVFVEEDPRVRGQCCEWSCKQFDRPGQGRGESGYDVWRVDFLDLIERWSLVLGYKNMAGPWLSAVEVVISCIEDRVKAFLLATIRIMLLNISMTSEISESQSSESHWHTKYFHHGLSLEYVFCHSSPRHVSVLYCSRCFVVVVRCWCDC